MIDSLWKLLWFINKIYLKKINRLKMLFKHKVTSWGMTCDGSGSYLMWSENSSLETWQWCWGLYGAKEAVVQTHGQEEQQVRRLRDQKWLFKESGSIPTRSERAGKWGKVAGVCGPISPECIKRVWHSVHTCKCLIMAVSETSFWKSEPISVNHQM